MVALSVRQNRPDPVERNSHSYPHPDNPGLLEQPGGFYDWAGRRLFLADGSPDPATPGAYRHQTRPDLCDLEAPDSDPASPRYEPPHLRHRPGDDWQIGGRPADPDDPGPYGSPGWHRDRRTGRHRRGELPDPVPPWETEEHDRVEPAPPRDTEDERPSPSPCRRHWTGPDEEPHRFSNLREDAWDRWLVDSEPLARAHRTAFGAAEGGFLAAAVIRFLRLVVALMKGHKEEERTQAAGADAPTVSLRAVPRNRVSSDGHASPYLLGWERRLDQLDPLSGGAL